jgi:hypothetical protein
MRPGNFVDDIQSEPKASVGGGVVLLRGASLEWMKDLIQDRTLNSWPAIPDLNENVGPLTSQHDMDRRVWYPILESIRYQVAEQLLEPQAVPATPGVARHRQFQLAARMRPTELLNLIREQRRQVGVFFGKGDAQPNLVRLKSTRSSSSAFMDAPLRIRREAASDTLSPAFSAAR